MSASPSRAEGNASEAPGTPGTPTSGEVSASNDELLDHLQSRAQVFNQLWQAVEKVQGDSISISTWKAKLKELDDAKAVSKKLKKELQAVSAKNSELVTVNAGYRTNVEELKTDIKTRDSRLIAAHAQIEDLGKEVEDVRLAWQRSESKVKRDLEALTMRHQEKLDEVNHAHEQVSQLVKELQQLKMELLRTKEVGRIESEALGQELEAARANVVALEADKDKISAHLWNVTDEIKKLANQLGESEKLKDHYEKESQEQAAALVKLKNSSKVEIKQLNDNLGHLRLKYDETLSTLSALRTQHEEEMKAHDLGAGELRKNLKLLQTELSNTKDSEKKHKDLSKKTAEELSGLKTSTSEEIARLKADLENERAANRAVLDKMEADLASARKELQLGDHGRSRLELELEEKNRMIELMRQNIADKDSELQKWQKDLMDKETAKNSVTKRLENQLMSNRRQVKELTAALDNLQVKADAEIGMERDRASEAESKVDRLIAAHKEEMGSVKAELNVLTEETFRLRSAVSNAEKATEKEREKVQNLKSQIDAGDEDMATVQSELREALEQHVKDSNRNKALLEKQQERLTRAENEKNDILREAGSLNDELGIALRERTKLEDQIQGLGKEKMAQNERLEVSKRQADELREQLQESQRRIEELTHGSYKSEEARANEVRELQRELKLTQKEAASRVARFSEQGRALATEIQTLTQEKRVLQEQAEVYVNSIEKKDEKVRELQGTLNDVHKLRDAVGKEATAMRTTMREQSAKIKLLEEQIQRAETAMNEEKEKGKGVDKERKIADRKRKEAERHVIKAEKEKMASALLVEKAESEKSALRAESNMRKEQCKQLEDRINTLLGDRDKELGVTAKQVDALRTDLAAVKGQVHKAQDDHDLERARREEAEKKIADTRAEAQTTIEGLMRECQALGSSKKAEVDRLNKELEQQIDFATTMKKERDRQAENSKAAIEAMKNDADTQRRLANLLEKEKTELKKMLQEKWTECQKMSLRVDEITETNAEAMRELDDWKSTRASLQDQIKRLETEKAELGWRAKETEDKMRSELKETTGRASHLAAEITSMKHQSLWSERESGVKNAQLEREIATLKAALDHKTQEHRASEKEIEAQQMQMRDMQNTSEYTIGLLRKELEETNNRSRMTSMEMKRTVDELRTKTNEAEEAVNDMRKELRSKRLQTESVTRELKHMTAEVAEKSRALETAENSRNSLLQELDRTRGDKTNMVQEVMQARDGAADEASQLSRQITGLNLRVSALSEELDQAHEMRANLEKNLRKQIESEFIDKYKMKNVVNTSTEDVMGSDAFSRSSAERDPVLAMRQLRESLVSQLEADRDLDRTRELASGTKNRAGPSVGSDIIEDTGSKDENKRPMPPVALPQRTMKTPEMNVGSEEEIPFVPTGNAAKDSVMRTERFLEKRRRRERYLEKQIESGETERQTREIGYEQMVERKTSSRESANSRGSRGSSRGGIRPRPTNSLPELKATGKKGGVGSTTTSRKLGKKGKVKK